MDADKVDFIGVDRESDETILTITDHLDWSDEQEHLLALQEKINTYLRFVESGEIFEKYPRAKGRIIVIEVVGMYPPNEAGSTFLEKAKDVTASAGVALRSRLSEGSDE